MFSQSDLGTHLNVVSSLECKFIKLPKEKKSQLSLQNIIEQKQKVDWLHWFKINLIKNVETAYHTYLKRNT